MRSPGTALASWNFASRRLDEHVAATKVLRIALFLVLFSFMFLPEYVQGTGDAGEKSRFYAQVFGGLRWMDVLLLAIVGVHAALLSSSSRCRVSFPKASFLWLGIFGVAVLAGMAYGAANGGENLFFDWRAIPVGAGVFVVYTVWLDSPADVRGGATLFVLYVSVRAAIFGLLYAQGAGAEIMGIRIPVFDGPTLSAIVCAALLGMALATTASGLHACCLYLCSLINSVIVLISFRRTYWAELAIGSLLFLGLSRGRKLAASMMAISLVVAFAALGPAAVQRLRSLDFTSHDSQFAGDNVDHVGDLLDAWEQLKASPLMGIGLGRSYATWEIREWKEESVMVHNAPLHVWLKYGLLGLASFLGFHLFLFKALLHRRCTVHSETGAIVSAALAYLLAQFIVRLGFSPWAYSAMQSTNLIGFLLALSFTPKNHVAPVDLRRHSFVQLRRVS